MAAGLMMETAVLGELHRILVHRGGVPRVYFWRTAAGHEVDFLIDDGQQLVPIEFNLEAKVFARCAYNPNHGRTDTPLRTKAWSPPYTRVAFSTG